MKKLTGNQSKLDLNKNGKLDSNDFKMLRGEMANGGGVEETMREKIAKMNISLNTKDGQVYVGGIKPKNKLFKDEKGYYLVDGYGKFMGKKSPVKKHFSMSENEVLEAYMQNKYAKGGKMSNGGGTGVSSETGFAEGTNADLIMNQDYLAYAKGGGTKNGGFKEITTNELDKVRDKVNSFLNPFGYSAKVEKSIGDVLYIIEPSTKKVGNKRSDFFDGMQILAMDNGTFEVSEYMAGENENELYIYKETNSLTNALKDLIKGNKRKPIKKYAQGGSLADTPESFPSTDAMSYKNGGGVGNVDTELIDASAKTIYDKNGMMGLRNTFLVLANTDEKSGDKSTADYRRKVVSNYQAKQPKFMENGGSTSGWCYSIGGL